MRLGKGTTGFATGLLVFSLVTGSPAAVLASSQQISSIQATNTSSQSTQLLNGLTFMTSSDSTLIAGETSTVNVRLFDQFNNPFDGNVTATLTAPDGTVKSYPISGSNGIFAVTGVNPLTAGSYTLTVSQGFNQYGKVYSAQGTITVLNSVATVTSGSLVLNSDSEITVKLTDSNGNPLAGKSVTVDATAVGGGMQNDTTLNDGTFNFDITPTESGTVYFEHGGLQVGSLAVADGGAANVLTTGSLVLNSPSIITATLVDPSGNPLKNKTVTLDETGIGGGDQNFTTLNDGTFKINLTPSQYGQVNFIYGGNIVGNMSVQAAYVAQPRIGSNIDSNAAMSVAVAQKGWQSAKNVILTRDDVLVDAMTAIPLSKKLDAPILMTPSGSLDSSVLTEIQSLKATNVYIIGGTGAVSSGIEDTLRGMGLTVNRLGGTDRYATAFQIAKLVGPSKTVYMAYGYGEPDAIAGSVFAAEQGYPVVLTGSSEMPSETQDYLANTGVTNIDILGGDGVVTPALESNLSKSYSVTRMGGADRYETEQAVSQNYFADKPYTDEYPVFFASSTVSRRDANGGTPDASALLAGALAAKQNGFLLMVPSNNLPDSINNFLLYNKVYIPQSTVVGNTNAVSENLEQQLEQVLSR